MKRSAPVRSSLQQPTSCRLCRTRKLKCDRESPCFNCSSRNVNCVYAAGAQEQSHIPGVTNTLPTQGTRFDHACHGDCAGLASRIQRLEAAVFPTETQQAVDHRAASHSVAARTENSRLDSNQDEEQQRTSRWLESMLINAHSERDSKIAEIPSARARSDDSTTSSSNLSTILSNFPSQSAAGHMLDHYLKTVNAIYRIHHIPTTYKLFRELYADLHAQIIPSATRLAFFLGIFAASAIVSKDQSHHEGILLSGRSLPLTASPSDLWSESAFSLLTNPPVPPSTQALQAHVGLLHLCTQIQGFNRTFGTLVMSTQQMARALKVHLLDTPRAREDRQKNGTDMVELEIKRRVWWHLVASDWLLPDFGGIFEGTYTLHPHQMQTNHPSNVEDEAIPTGITHDETYSLPLSIPTSISAFIYRIQVATLAREVIDSLPASYFSSPGGMDTDEDTYSIILHLDHKYQRFLQSLPSAFQLNQPNRKQENEPSYLQWQRPFINFIVHTRIARLHRPFLIRGSTGPRFAYSRMQCIRSAEIVLEIGNSMTQGPAATEVGRFLYFMQHYLMATVILAMDVCFSPYELRVSERKQVVLQACRVMEDEVRLKLGTVGMGSTGHQVPVQGFQKAVNGLRSVLKRHVQKDQGSGASISSEGPLLSSPVVGFSAPPPPYEHHVERQQVVEERAQIQQLDAQRKMETQYQDEVAHMIDVEPTLHELWDGLFSVGATFDGSDWDSFLVDVNAQIG